MLKKEKNLNFKLEMFERKQENISLQICTEKYYVIESIRCSQEKSIVLDLC